MRTNETPKRVVLGGGWKLWRYRTYDGPFLVLEGPRAWRCFLRFLDPRGYDLLMQANPN